MNRILILLTFSFISFVLTHTSPNTQGKILGKVTLIDSSRITFISVNLEGANRTTFLNEEGVFVFHNVDPGIYLVNVNDNQFHYDQVLVEVTNQEVKAFQYNIKSGKGLKFQNQMFEMKPQFKILFEEESPNIINSIVKSPYFILIGVTVLMFICMQAVPKDQLNEQMTQMNKQMGQYQNLFKPPQ